VPPPIVATAPARAALAGNPSDLYGGAVLAVPVTSFTARVDVRDAPATTIVGDERGRDLVAAAIRRAPATDAPFQLRWSSDIPFAVGLAGSSAIVVATLRALAARAGAELDALDLALLALAVEVEELGMVAGLQDRATQAFAAPVLVDMAATERVTVVRPARPVRIAVAWCEAAGASSDEYHRDLRASEPPRMDELAALARRAAGALAAGDATALATVMGESAAVRSTVAPLSAAHDTLAAAVTDAGLVPNSAGSGGAVAAVVTDDDSLERARGAVRGLGGDVVVETFG